MAAFTFLAPPNKFPEGTSVGVYPLANWPNRIADFSAAPPGSATDTETVTNGVCAFSGLVPGDTYYAYAQVASQHRYVGIVAPVGSGQSDEISRAEITANFPTSSTTYVDVTGLSITIPPTSRAVTVKAGAGTVNNANALGGFFVALVVDGQQQAVAVKSVNDAAEGDPCYVEARIPPSTASRIAKVQMKVSLGTATMGASPVGSGAYGPAYIAAEVT